MRNTHAPIRAFVGLNGSGKTLAAMALVVSPVLERGGSVMANLVIDGPADRVSLFSGWRDLVHLEQDRLLRQSRGEKLLPLVLFLDEITSVLPSRQSQSLPPQLARMFNQLRKVNVLLVWTAPNWARADKLLREVTGTVTVCRGTFPDRWQRDEGGKRKLLVDGKPVRSDRDWAPNRLFRFSTYSAEDFEEFTLTKTAKLRPVGKSWYRRKAHDHHLRYDTRQAVMLLDHVDEGGACITCGGSRPRPKCSCPTVVPVQVKAAPAAEPAPAALDAHLVDVVDPWETFTDSLGGECDPYIDHRLVAAHGLQDAIAMATAEPIPTIPHLRWQA